MATYAVGDLQGCFKSFMALLQCMDFSPTSDRLWLAGDLVNRGPDSLAVLRWLRQHDTCVTAVLGNHDLHLLARAANAAEPKKRDTLDEVLAAPDRAELLAWLAQRPLFHREGQHALLHAGLLPLWSLDLAAELAKDLETALRSGRIAALHAAGRRQKELPWSNELTGDDRLGAALRVLTNVRLVDGRGQAKFDYSAAPSGAPPGYRPWFQARSETVEEPRFFFGHWSALGFYVAPGATCLDSGCVWGQSLTGVRLEDGRVFHQRSLEKPSAPLAPPV